MAAEREERLAVGTEITASPTGNPLLAAWDYCDNHRHEYAEVVANPLTVCLPAKIGLWAESWRK